jgi:hypothetical protein
MMFSRFFKRLNCYPEPLTPSLLKVLEKNGKETSPESNLPSALVYTGSPNGKPANPGKLVL